MDLAGLHARAKRIDELLAGFEKELRDLERTPASEAMKLSQLQYLEAVRLVVCGLERARIGLLAIRGRLQQHGGKHPYKTANEPRA